MNSAAHTLTAKQEAFVQAYIETGNGCEAYRRAYSAAKMSARAVEVEASKLLKHPDVTLRLRQGQAAAAERHEVTVDSLTKWLMDARELAIASRSPAAAVTAIMAIAKLHGMFKEVHEHSGPDGGPIRYVDEADAFTRRIAGIAPRVGTGSGAGETEH